MAWFDQYILQPIYSGSGYNFVNTTIYALVAIAILYLLFKIFVRLKIRINFKFFISTIPFIVLGSSTRAFVDNGYITRNLWTVSPGIYFVIAALFLIVMFLSFAISQKFKTFDWRFATFFVGLVVLVFQWFRFSRELEFVNMNIFLLIVGTIILSAICFHYIFVKLGWKWITNKFGFLAFSAHLFDSVTTALLLYFVGGWEQHPLPRFFIERFGSLSFIPVKLVVIIPAVYILSAELKNKQLRDFLLMSIAILGFAEALRNLISMIL